MHLLCFRYIETVLAIFEQFELFGLFFAYLAFWHYFVFFCVTKPTILQL